MVSIVDDDRLFLFLAVVAFCNLVPLVAFFAYLIASSFVIVATALLAEVLSLIFGLAVFVPIFVFSTLSAVVITGIIILMRSFIERTTTVKKTPPSSREPPPLPTPSPPPRLATSPSSLASEWKWEPSKKYD
uniref:Transmembrane protein n=1 Tax=Steinernema glaseri TaxID=37863 RepID=A0A1I7YSZ7_9BILA